MGGGLHTMLPASTPRCVHTLKCPYPHASTPFPYPVSSCQEYCNASLQDALRNRLLHKADTKVPDMVRA